MHRSTKLLYSSLHKRLIYMRSAEQRQDLSSFDVIKKKVKKEGEKPLKYTIEGQYVHARAANILLPHGEVKGPVFMPVGTKGTMKGLTSRQMEDLGCKILLSNTYHLGNKPGPDFLAKVGGLHKFMNWPNNILTDSGGFQMVSLSKLCEITEKGVSFKSPYDDSIMFIRPEDSIQIQNKIGSDIMMALDDVVKTTTVGPRMEEAMERTVRWCDRNLKANLNPDRQNLFPIVQGGIDQDLRRRALQKMADLDVSGFAIGGLAGGQAKRDFFSTVRFSCQHLPKNKPRYLMGVGYPVDIALCSALGVDMFDCVFPTRTARFGTAFTSKGQIKLKAKNFATDFTPLDEGCQCQACQNFTRAYLHMIQNEDTFCHLLSMHNISFNFRVMRGMRKAILQGTTAEYLQNFLNQIYSTDKKIPSWVKIALDLAELKVEFKYPLFETQK